MQTIHFDRMRQGSSAGKSARHVFTSLLSRMGLLAFCVLLPMSGGQSSTGSKGGSEAIEVETVILTSSGFVPAKISRPSGPFVLVVYNCLEDEGDTTLDWPDDLTDLVGWAFAKDVLEAHAKVDLKRGVHKLRDHRHLKRILEIEVGQ